MRTQHILQGDFAYRVLRPGQLFQFGEQIKCLPVDLDFLIKEVELINGFFKIERGLQQAIDIFATLFAKQQPTMAR